MAFTKCWLAYPEIRGCRCDAISLHTELTGETIDRAKAELAEGFKGLYGAALTEGDDITLALDTTLDPEGYRLKAADGHCTIEGGSEVGVLYGVFALLRNLQTAGKAWAQFTADEEKAPSNRLRMLKVGPDIKIPPEVTFKDVKNETVLGDPNNMHITTGHFNLADLKKRSETHE